MRRQAAVAANLSDKQLLRFAFALTLTDVCQMGLIMCGQREQTDNGLRVLVVLSSLLDRRQAGLYSGKLQR